MGSLVKSIFGGKDTSAQKAQVEANAGDRALFEMLADKASGQARALTGAGDENRNMALQQVLNLLGGIIPQQLGAQQQLDRLQCPIANGSAPIRQGVAPIQMAQDFLGHRHPVLPECLAIRSVRTAARAIRTP